MEAVRPGRANPKEQRSEQQQKGAKYAKATANTMHCIQYPETFHVLNIPERHRRSGCAGGFDAWATPGLLSAVVLCFRPRRPAVGSEGPRKDPAAAGGSPSRQMRGGAPTAGL